MGRTYQYECSRCGYRARVSGRADEGFHFAVQTIVCWDCKTLYDAVQRVRIPELSESELRRTGFGMRGFGWPYWQRRPEAPPSFSVALNRLTFNGPRRFKWVDYKLRCPTSPSHHIEKWNEPNKCPKCNTLLDKHPLPFRIWD